MIRPDTMKKSLILIILSAIMLTACSTRIKVDDSYANDHKFSSYLRGYWGTEEIDVTGTDKGFYSVKDGKLSYFDYDSFTNIVVSSINYQDDEAVSECDSYKKYCMTYKPNFLEFYDGYVYFITTYHSIEGESSVYLTRIREDGSKYERVIELEDEGYEYYLIKGMFFYVSSKSQEIIMVDINSNKSNYINLDAGDAFGKFSSDGNDIIMTTFRSETETVLLKFNFDNREFEEIYETCCGLSDVSDEKLLMLSKETDGTTFGSVVSFDGEVILTINDEERFMNYIDHEYVYTSSMETPQKHIVYDFKGNIVEEYSVPDKYVINENEKFFTAENFLEATQILGISDDYLFVITSTEKGLVYVLIDRETGEWNEVSL